MHPRPSGACVTRERPERGRADAGWWRRWWPRRRVRPSGPGECGAPTPRRSHPLARGFLPPEPSHAPSNRRDQRARLRPSGSPLSGGLRLRTAHEGLWCCSPPPPSPHQSMAGRDPSTGLSCRGRREEGGCGGKLLGQWKRWKWPPRGRRSLPRRCWLQIVSY